MGNGDKMARRQDGEAARRQESTIVPVPIAYCLLPIAYYLLPRLTPRSELASLIGREPSGFGEAACYDGQVLTGGRARERLEDSSGRIR